MTSSPNGVRPSERDLLWVGTGGGAGFTSDTNLFGGGGIGGGRRPLCGLFEPLLSLGGLGRGTLLFSRDTE